MAVPIKTAMARDDLVRLRRRIAEIEGHGTLNRPVLAETAGAATDDAPPALAPRRAGQVLSFGIGAIDGLLGGGLRRSALHEIRGEASRNSAATGFAIAMLARLADCDDRPVLWITETTAGREAGHPYGAGLDRFGLPAKRVILVGVRKPLDALWVFEEGLRCRGLAAVLTEIRGHPTALDLTASRRLALRARDSGVMGLFLRQVDQPDPGAAETRWRVTPRPAGTLDGYPAGIGRPAWRLTLERNRRGATGVIDLEWDHATRDFLAIATARPAYSRPVAAPSADRSPPSPDAGQVVAFRDVPWRTPGGDRQGEERHASGGA